MVSKLEQKIRELDNPDEIGGWLGSEAENKRQLAKYMESRALEKLYKLAKQSGLYDWYAEKL